LYLALWEEGAKGPEGKSSWQKIKAQRSNLEMLLLGIPEKEIKGFSSRKKGGTHKKIKLKTWLVDRGSHHEPTYYVHGHVVV
jgi:hypothetical protein